MKTMTENDMPRGAGRFGRARIGRVMLILLAILAVCGTKRATILVIVTMLTLLGLCAPAHASISTGDGGWVWQNPLPQGNDLNDVTFVDAAHGWAVGMGGLILATSDGGATWSVQRPAESLGNLFPFGYTLYAVTFVDLQHGWAVGESGVILTTSDGGRHWTAQDPDNQAFDTALCAITFIDSAHGWAVGNYGQDGPKILTTSNGGADWSVATLPTDVRVNDVAFTDATHGWVVGGSTHPDGSWDSVFLTTSNAGASWSTQPVTNPDPDSNPLLAITFVDASHGWVVGPSESVLTTTDGGTTWVRHGSMDLEGYACEDVTFVDDSHGWVISADAVYVTSSGGATWMKQSLPVDSGSLTAIAFPDTSHGCVVGERGSIFITSNGGTTWNDFPGTNSMSLYDVAFSDSTHGWAVGYDYSWTVPNLGYYGGILATSNGGATWSVQSDGGATEGLKGVAASDADHVWAVGNRWDGGLGKRIGVVIATSNGGATWNEQTPPQATDSLNDVDFISATHGWAVGYAGTILVTKDGGDTWTTQDSGTNEDFWAVSFVDAYRGWAAGNSGTIVATSDGGSTWRAQTSGTTQELWDVCFVDAIHGWAVAWGDAIIATDDGGDTWKEQNNISGGSGTLHLDGVCFVDANHGWAVGDRVIATSDGGATWTSQYAGGGDLQAIDFTDTAHGWAVGDAGTIIATSTGGRPLTTDTIPPTTTVSGADDAWHNSPVELTFSAGDNTGGSGVATTEYSLDGGAFTTGTSLTVSSAGSHTVSYRSTDLAGNTETAKTCTVKIDLTAPTTSIPSAAPSGWSKTAVTFGFVPSDALSGMSGGVARTEYSSDGGVTWTTGASATVSAQGSTTLQYRSVDAAGNVEAAKSVTVRVDSAKPTTKAFKASVKKGKKVKLAYQVSDALPGSGQAKVTLKIFKGSKVKKTIAIKGTVACNAKKTQSWKCTLPKGAYTLKVYATDLAGNAQSKVGSAKLTVK
jgi:photosystem II stability/assembly factor-like uncharacterized protein